jgi:hypothetical protein
VRILLAVAIASFGMALAGAPVRAIEQEIEPLTPPAEQHVEIVGAAEQGVDGIDQQALEVVEPHEPPSPAAKAASNVGQAILGVTAAVVSLGVMAASLLLL